MDGRNRDCTLIFDYVIKDYRCDLLIYCVFWIAIYDIDLVNKCILHLARLIIVYFKMHIYKMYVCILRLDPCCDLPRQPTMSYLISLSDCL